jgi:predicted Zn finger-like uncharacterized protein
MQITHCPECETAFKVTPEHLALAKGWVRCGRCGAVFEALKQLTPPDDTEASLEAQPEEPVHAFQSAPSSRLHPSVSRLRRSEAAWEMPRWLMLSVSGLLLLLLLWQALLWKRHWLAAQEPALRGPLGVLCAPVGCEVTWPQAPDALLIESSSFMRDADNFYTVQVRIKNIEHHPVAAPSLELTLVDAQEDVVLRRVFSPEEMGLPDHVAALREAKAMLSFSLGDPVIERVTGYRALLFYP